MKGQALTSPRFWEMNFLFKQEDEIDVVLCHMCDHTKNKELPNILILMDILSIYGSQETYIHIGRSQEVGTQAFGYHKAEEGRRSVLPFVTSKDPTIGF